MASDLVLGLNPRDLMLVGTGGGAAVRNEWADGKPSETPMVRNGGALRRLSGIAVALNGVGLDGATIESTTPLDKIESGVVFRAEGECELRVWAAAKKNERSGKLFAELNTTLFVERLVPVGNAFAAALAKAQRTAAAAG